ncbi:superoxide dismutase, Cu-Zn family [Thalassobacillus cyri]|uniref:Superoxide dismutase, Cu-Zn family n=1 Tax=Thalassobacillus cyri TaxID=571932 RepID=A0A1H4G9U6_9BACI|nr:superoxide dismutase family protein [Thalassobacillus cyri]SEB06051.1 superoxide dismutase, Cu-Zn family [Thalassobacillus cyri]
MDFKKWFMIGFLAFILIGCQNESRSNATVGLYNKDGDMIGTAKLTETSTGVEVLVNAEGLEPGPHGFHLHEFPVCEGPDFTSAGNHFNPTGKVHGLMNTEGSHVGDMPNLEADASGKIVEAKATLAEATLLDGKNSLMKGEGTSLIIHEAIDDGFSQPAGEAGGRVACGKIQLNDEGEMPTDPMEQKGKKEEE